MTFEGLLSTIGNRSVFRTDDLGVRTKDLGTFRNQLAKWQAAGKIVQFRRGVYAVAAPYRPRPAIEALATAMLEPAYVSLELALSYYGLIPDGVMVVTVVTTGRSVRRLETPHGSIVAEHITPRLFWGFKPVEFREGQFANMAEPEKALLDLIHLTARGDSHGYLKELRLQNSEFFSLERLQKYARQTKSPKLIRAADRACEILREEAKGWKPL